MSRAQRHLEKWSRVARLELDERKNRMRLYTIQGVTVQAFRDRVRSRSESLTLS